MGQPKHSILNWPHIKMDKNFQILSQAINLQNSILFPPFCWISHVIYTFSKLFKTIFTRERKETVHDQQKSHEGEVTDHSDKIYQVQTKPEEQ